jgi:hypothetical protein
MNEQTTKRVAQIHKSILRLGNMRDGLLVGGAVLYGFGYVAFSVSAWIHHLGPVPGIEAQYFIAGIPVAVVVLLGIAIALAFHRFQTVIWPSWYAGAGPGVQWVMMGVMALALTAFFIYSLTLGRAQASNFSWRHVVVLIVMTLLLPLFLRMAHDFSPPRRVYSVVLKAYRYVTVIYIVVFAVFFSLVYLRFGYERIPQALGGGAPRAAILAINSETLPSTTLHLLIRNVPAKGEKLVESIPLLVLVDTKETLLVATRERQAGKSWDTFEISKSSITSVRWLE